MNLVNELLRPNVHIKHKEGVAEKLHALTADGAKSLQVISDFDATLSQHTWNGKRCPSTHGVLEQNAIKCDDTRKMLASLFEHYHAIEIDANLSIDEKIPFMIEWYEKNHEIIMTENLTRDHIKQAVADSRAMLRDGCNRFFSELDHHHIPLLIFSAGVGDVLREVIEQKSTFHSNMRIISNFMKFDQQGYMRGLQSDLIHTFNKNEGAIANSEYFRKMSSRHNVLLLGDMMGDLKMSDGIDDINVCLKVGYLNAKVDELLDAYMDEWDIVLVQDQTLDIANQILSFVVAT